MVATMTGTPRQSTRIVTTNLPATARSPIKVGEVLSNSSGELESFRNAVGGILPGYSGHRPGARDKYGGSAVGNVLPFGGPMRQGNLLQSPPSAGAQTSRTARYFSPESHKWGDKDSLERDYRLYKEEVNGIVPGYAGHIPSARDEVGQTAYGNVPKKALPQKQSEAIGKQPEAIRSTAMRRTLASCARS